MDTLAYMTIHYENTIELFATRPKAFYRILKIVSDEKEWARF